MVSINDCPNLTQPQISNFFQIKKKLLIACGTQIHNDLVLFSTEFFTTIYSAIYNEFSIAASFFPPRKESNACHFYIEKMIKLCPSEETFFNKKSLQYLRENFNNK